MGDFKYHSGIGNAKKRDSLNIKIVSLIINIKRRFIMRKKEMSDFRFVLCLIAAVFIGSVLLSGFMQLFAWMIIKVGGMI